MSQSPTNAGPWLIVTAAPAEARAVCAGFGRPEVPGEWSPACLDGRFELLVTGIGKSNAAGSVARFADPARHAGILNVGVAGMLPGSGLALGQVVIADRCVYADEGILTPDGFLDCGQMGFPLGDFPGRSVPVSSELVRTLGPLAARVGAVATVSTCSGTDAAALEVAARTGALAEGMEGAAVAHVAHRFGLPVGELRVISNTTGDRPGQSWDLRGALDALRAVLGRVRQQL